MVDSVDVAKALEGVKQLNKALKGALAVEEMLRAGLAMKAEIGDLTRERGKLQGDVAGLKKSVVDGKAALAEVRANTAKARDRETKENSERRTKFDTEHSAVVDKAKKELDGVLKLLAEAKQNRDQVLSDLDNEIVTEQGRLAQLKEQAAILAKYAAQEMVDNDDSVRLAKVERTTAVTYAKLVSHTEEEAEERERLVVAVANVQKDVASIKATLAGQKGFISGVLFVMAGVGALAAMAWQVVIKKL